MKGSQHRVSVTFEREVRIKGEIFNLTEVMPGSATPRAAPTPHTSRRFSMPRLAPLSPLPIQAAPQTTRSKKKKRKFFISPPKTPSQAEIVAEAKLKAMLTESKARIQK